MFGINKMKEELKELKQFEEGVCTVVDNYFENNEVKDLKFSTHGGADKFCLFVMSIDKRMKELENKLCEKDSEIASKNEKIAEQEKIIEQMQEEINADNDELASKDEKIEEQNAIMNAQAKEIETLAKEKSALEIQLTAKKREMDRAKGGKR